MGNIYSKSYNRLKKTPSDEIVRTKAFRVSNTYQVIHESMICKHDNNVYLCRICK